MGDRGGEPSSCLLYRLLRSLELSLYLPDTPPRMKALRLWELGGLTTEMKKDEVHLARALTHRDDVVALTEVLGEARHG